MNTALPLFALGLASPALAATLQVGPTRALSTPCAAAAVISDGDIVQIDAGTYVGDVCIWTASGLTLEGVDGYAHLEADGESAGGKAIWVIQGDDVTVRWIEFSGATVPDQNGAGIRQEGTGLTVDRCWFHDNENGILAGDDEDSDIVVQNSIFERNGYGDGYSHNLYINHVRSLSFVGNLSTGAYRGHQLKSRAYTNLIAYNRLADGDEGEGSYEIDLPNGGIALIVGNLIQQGPLAQNSAMISFAEEGATNPEQALYLGNNTFVNDLGRGTFVRNANTEIPAWMVNNLLVGGGTVLDGYGEESADLETEEPGFVDRDAGDYHLTEGSPAIDAGVELYDTEGVSLAPSEQVSGPAETEPRPRVGAIDVGALEYGTPDTGEPADPCEDCPEDEAETGSDEAEEVLDSGSPKGTGGCGCASGSQVPTGGVVLALALALSARRGRRAKRR